MFQKNDYVVYGNNGVCRIKEIGPLDIPGISKEQIYYTLVPYYAKDSQIFTPVDSTKVVMRSLIHKDTIMQLLEELPDMEPLWVKDEKQRETQYKETLRKCDCRELIRTNSFPLQKIVYMENLQSFSELTEIRFEILLRKK